MTRPRKRVAVIGGGLAGLAAAVSLTQDHDVTLFESRRQLGGRAGSFYDSENDVLIDHCQHVGMGCCTQLIEFCKTTGILELFRRDRVLHFFGPDGKRCDLGGTDWLPAPLHLAGSLLGLKYLTWRERLSIGLALLRLKRTPATDSADGPTVGAWLRKIGQSQQAIDRFWSIVLISALGESIDRASLAAARKVFVDGFMTGRDSYHLLTPAAPLSEIYDQRVAQWLQQQGTEIRLETPIEKLEGSDKKIESILSRAGERLEFDHYVVAVPWRRVAELFPEPLQATLGLAALEKIESSPITGVHLWFDRPITDLPHGVLIDRLSQWVFHHADASKDGRWYYQVVISQSRDLAKMDRDEIIEQVQDDLQAIFPLAREAQLLNSRVVTDHHAVFSTVPGLDDIRPSQATSIDNLSLAGDWTQTGWPATMEGAIRSGNLAAAAVHTTS